MNSVGAVRIRIIRIFIGCLLAVFVARLWQLQLTQWVTYAKRALGNRIQVLRQEGPRGLILDRNGRVLAENRTRWLLGVDPQKFPRRDDLRCDRCITRLASILDVSAADLRKAIFEALSQTSAQPVPVKGFGEDLTLAEVARIEEHRLELPGIVVLEVSQRFYPCGRLAAHVLGYARLITAEQYERWRDLSFGSVPIGDSGQSLPVRVYSPNSIVGQAGVEALCELDRSVEPPVPILVGRPGIVVQEVDVTGQPVRVIYSQPPSPGATVFLTIDAKIQKAAEDALEDALRAGRGTGGACVVLDPNTGEVLAMASKPSFDPNKWVKGFEPEEWRRINSDPRTPLLNRAISGLYPPGSTFKIISAVAALESINLSPSTSFFCSGRIVVGYRHQVFRCWKRSGHGRVSFWRGIAESCDVYFYELVRKGGLTAEAIAYWAKQFGLGRETGIGLAGEMDGLVPTPEWKIAIRRERWRLGDTLNFVIGQGFLTVTPLQMAVATAAVANGGKIYRPHLVRKIYWPAWMGRPPRKIQPELVATVPCKPQTLELVRRAMRMAVASPHGTGRALASFPVPVAGKTGSAQHRPGRPTHAWFVCFAPYRNPKYVCVVFVENGGHGGSTAAPIARRVLAAAFGVTAAARSTVAGGETD